MDPHGKPDDHELVERIRAGDHEAESLLFERYRPVVLAWVRRYARRELMFREDASDLAQTAIRVAVRDLPEFEDRGDGAFAAWLHRYVRTRVRDKERFWRAERREGQVPLGEGLAEPVDFCGRIEARERLALVEEAFQSLSREDRLIVQRVRIERRTHAEVAEEFGLTPAATKQRLRRALLWVAKRIDRE